MPPNDTLEHCPPDSVLIEYGRKAVIEERRSFDGAFNEALQLVKDRRCYSMGDLAARFGHGSAWATRFKECVLRQGLMSLDEFAMCFQRRRDGRGRPVCGLNGMSGAETRLSGAMLLSMNEVTKVTNQLKEN